MFFLFRTDEWTRDKVPFQEFYSPDCGDVKQMKFNLTYAMNGRTLMVEYSPGILPQPQAT